MNFPLCQNPSRPTNPASCHSPKLNHAIEVSCCFFNANTSSHGLSHRVHSSGRAGADSLNQFFISLKGATNHWWWIPASCYGRCFRAQNTTRDSIPFSDTVAGLSFAKMIQECLFEICEQHASIQICSYPLLPTYYINVILSNSCHVVLIKHGLLFYFVKTCEM